MNFSHDLIAKVIAIVAHVSEIVRLWIRYGRLCVIAHFVHDGNILLVFGIGGWEGAGHAQILAEKVANDKKFFVFL